MVCGKRHFCRHVPSIVNHHGLHRALLHPDGVYLPFEFTREYGVESLHKAFALAQKYQRMVDVHCDEIDDEQSRFVETVAALAHRENMGARVTASHTTAMHSYNGAYTSRLFRLLTLSGINFVANPLVHIHLQGRFDSYPKRRGITRVKEMPVRYSIRHGRVIAETQPALSQIHLESSEQVDFRR